MPLLCVPFAASIILCLFQVSAVESFGLAEILGHSDRVYPKCTPAWDAILEHQSVTPMFHDQPLGYAGAISVPVKADVSRTLPIDFHHRENGRNTAHWRWLQLCSFYILLV